ncbi:MAG: Uma2 family endonuclease [Chloroflexi bacterium]|nr:Uma2 family endonuclease [Chloroflexota bacterium]
MTTKTKRVYIERYYDSHEVEGEEVGQSWEHFAAIEYLLALLNCLFYGQQVGIGSSINLYQTEHPKERPKSPDVMIVDGLNIAELDNKKGTPSYYIGEDGSPPRVAFEISSYETWKTDLEEKPAKYAAMGIREYFAFDPIVSGLWRDKWHEYGRLIGWRKESNSSQYQEIPKDELGRLWSEQLQSWLVVEGKLLRLYTAEGQVRLTKEEMEYRRAETERQLRIMAENQTETIRRKAEENERQLETEREHAKKLAELLRRHNLDPDNL